MYTNDEKKYNAVLKELGDVLEKKNAAINVQKWEIEELKEKLSAAEAELAFAKEKLAEASVHINALLDENQKLKGGAE